MEPKRRAKESILSTPSPLPNISKKKCPKEDRHPHPYRPWRRKKKKKKKKIISEK
jgi:hypothetical protein